MRPSYLLPNWPAKKGENQVDTSEREHASSSVARAETRWIAATRIMTFVASKTDPPYEVRSCPDPLGALVASNRMARTDALRMAGGDVKRSCVPPFLALGIRRRTSNSLFELLRQSESPLLGNVADDQIAASVVGPRGERQITAAL